MCCLHKAPYDFPLDVGMTPESYPTVEVTRSSPCLTLRCYLHGPDLSLTVRMEDFGQSCNILTHLIEAIPIPKLLTDLNITGNPIWLNPSGVIRMINCLG